MPDATLALLTATISGDSFVGIYDDRDHLRYANDAFLKAFSLKAGDEATFASIILNAAREKKGVRIEAADPDSFIADVEARRRVSTRHPHQRVFPVDFVNDKWFWCTETLLPNGWICSTGADITTLKLSERELLASRDHALQLSQVDELTGVPNRRFTLGTLDKLLHSAAIDGTDLSLAVLDLDHFKSINDRFGHETGDRVLRHFAVHCASCVRDKDLVGRLGGEEFVVLLPGIRSDESKNVLEAILNSIPPVPVDGGLFPRITVSFSAGVADARPGEKREEVLARADTALYLAKRTGRSRVEVYKPPMHPPQTANSK